MFKQSALFNAKLTPAVIQSLIDDTKESRHSGYKKDLVELSKLMQSAKQAERFGWEYSTAKPGSTGFRIINRLIVAGIDVEDVFLNNEPA